MATGSGVLLKISKKSWSTEEDSKLLRLVDEIGINGSWSIIASKFEDRSGKQCRERYHNHLKPDITKKMFTKEEDALVIELQQSMGNQWAKIAKQFNGRSDNAVKNRWHILNRNKLPLAGAHSHLSVVPPTTTPRNAPVIITPPNMIPASRKPPIPILTLPSAAAAAAASNVKTVTPTSVAHSHTSGQADFCYSSTQSGVVYQNSQIQAVEGVLRNTHISNNLANDSERVQSKSICHTVSASFDNSDEVATSGNFADDNWIDDLFVAGDLLLTSDCVPLSLTDHDHDDWSCDGDDDGPVSYTKTKLTDLIPNVFADDSIVSPSRAFDDSNNMKTEGGIVHTVTSTTTTKVFDTFSEAALSAREDPDSSGGDYDENEQSDCYFMEEDDTDDLSLFFDDTMSFCGSAKPSPYRTYMVKLTERSPLCSPASCPNVKRQRGRQPGGSPFGVTPSVTATAAFVTATTGTTTSFQETA